MKFTQLDTMFADEFARYSDDNGQTVATLAEDAQFSACNHESTFDGSEFASGIYFVHAEIEGRVAEFVR